MERMRACGPDFGSGMGRCVLLLGLGFWLAAGSVWAQVVPGSRAQVYSVPTTGEAGRFQVPQVKLPTAAVANRINRVLLRRFRDDANEQIDSTASPRRQVRQAVYQCCFDEDSKSWMAGGLGTTGMRYEVLLNQNYLLLLAFQDENQGLEQPGGPHLTFDLRTGRVLTLADLVADPPARLGRRLQAAISRRLRDNLAEAVANYGDDSSQIADVARLYDIEIWDTTPRRGMAMDAAPDDGTGVVDWIRWLRWKEFALQPDALLLYHTVGMSRLSFEFLPDETYTFPYARLKPKGLLVAVAKAAQAAPRKAKRRH